MGLETATYIGGLNASNPAGTDPKRQGDDHIRMIKQALLQCFAGFTGSVLVGGQSSGAVNNYALTPNTPLISYTLNTMVVWMPNATSTSTAPTLNISGLGPRLIRAVDGNPLQPGDLPVGQFVAMIDNGTEFRLLAITKNYIDNLAFETVFPTPPAGGGPYFLSYYNGGFSYVTSTIPDFLLQSQGIA